MARFIFACLLIGSWCQSAVTAEPRLSPRNAKASKPTVDSVLAKWEAASQMCKTLDAKLTVWKYDGVFGNGQPEVSYGRFYYEAPNQGRYEIWTGPEGKTNDWSTTSVAFIWNGKETLQIDGRISSLYQVHILRGASVPAEPHRSDRTRSARVVLRHAFRAETSVSLVDRCDQG